VVFRYKHGDRPLEGYTIQRGVGAGGFGEVYFAVSDGGRQVALKCLQQNPEIELRGVGQCMNLKSPYLVTIFDVKIAPDGSSFVIMEYVTGPSLRDLLREAPSGLGPEKTAFFTREISKGLGFLHERGIVHRDLKPENIFYEDGSVKIGDYGLSKYISVSRQSCQTISVGTVHYMAPEIGSGRYHRGIDIYALGVMAFEMLSGRVPFTGDSFGEILMKHLTVEPDLSGIAAPFAPVVKKALAKNPDERYGRVEELNEELLRNPQVASWLSSFRSESLQAAASPPGPARETVVLGAGPPPAGAPASPRPERGAPAPERASQPPSPMPGPSPQGPAGTGAQAPFADRGGFWFHLGGLLAPEARQRHVFSLITAGSMAFALSLITGRGDFQSFLGSLIVILSGAAAALVIEREVPGQAVFEPGLPRRLLTLCLAAPFYLVATRFFPDKGTFIPLLVTTALVNWGDRTRLQRLERVSINQAFAAGVFSAVIAFVLKSVFDWRTDAFLVGGCLAAISLCLNVSSPFVPRPAGGRKRPPPPRDELGQIVAGAQGASGQNAPAPTYVQAAPYGPRPLPVSGPPQAMGALARIFWWGSAAVFLATSLSLFFFTIFALRGRDEVSVGYSFSFASFGYFIFCTRVAWCQFWPGFLRVARGWLVVSLVNTAGISGICLLHLGLRDAEPALFFLIFSLVFALFLLLLPRRRSRQAAEAPESTPPPQNPGWSTLGALLVTMGISVSLGSALLASGLADSIRAEVEAPAGLRVQTFVGSQLHLLAGLALFLPGLFCTLRSRQGQGAAHVLRGASGFLTLGTLVFITSKLLQSVVRTYPGEGLQLGFVPPGVIFGLFLTGILAAVLLFWPARTVAPALRE
jgi:hypothetical protein